MPDIGQNLSEAEADGRQLEGIRIARISTVAFFLVTQLRGQVEKLAEMGADVTLICSPGPELKQLHLGPRLRYIPEQIERSIHSFHDLLLVLRLFRLFRRERFDIIHTTTPKAGLVAGLAAFLARVPVRMHTYTGQVWVTQRGVMRQVTRFADKVIGMLATRCYADSPSQCAFLVSEGIVSKRKLKGIGQGSLAGVDLRRFDPRRFDEQDRNRLRAKLGISGDASVFLFVGRIASDKGVHELLDAFAKIRAEGYDAVLVLAGPLNEECGGEASISGEELRSRESVHYTGFCDEPERLLSITDVLCLPSYREGFGTVVIEAASMGVPTIGTRIVGLVDAVKDGETGLLVEPMSSDALAEAMRRILAEDSLRERLASAAQARCRAMFDSNVITAAVASEYVSALADTGRHPVRSRAVADP